MHSFLIFFVPGTNPQMLSHPGICVSDRIHLMIPGSKGRKSDASLLAGGFLTLGPAKNMSKQPFFVEKCADYECF